MAYTKLKMPENPIGFALPTLDVEHISRKWLDVDYTPDKPHQMRNWIYICPRMAKVRFRLSSQYTAELFGAELKMICRLQPIWKLYPTALQLSVLSSASAISCPAAIIKKGCFQMPSSTSRQL